MIQIDRTRYGCFARVALDCGCSGGHDGQVGENGRAIIIVTNSCSDICNGDPREYVFTSNWQENVHKRVSNHGSLPELSVQGVPRSLKCSM